MKQFDSTSYFETINSDKLTLVKYKANWCGPCRVLSPILEDVVKNYPDINFGEVDVDTHGDLAVRDGIRGVPAVIFYKNGQVLDKMVGLQQAQDYQNKINSLIN
jgi:thioredoxin 1